MQIVEPNSTCTSVTVASNTFNPAQGEPQCIAVDHNYGTTSIVIDQNTFNVSGFGVFARGSKGLTISNNTFTPLATATTLLLLP